MRNFSAAITAFVLFACPASAMHGSPATAKAEAPRAAVARPGLSALETVLSSFVENRGQASPSVLYYGTGPRGRVSFMTGGVTIAFGGAARASVTLEFVGADPTVRPVGRRPTTSAISIFRGAPDEWTRGVAAFEEIRYPRLWPGVDVVFHTGEGGQLEYDLDVAPGADVGRVGLAFEGADGVRIGSGGALEVDTRAGVLRQAAPRAYQNLEGRRVAVASRFRLGGDPEGKQFGFEVGDYDRSTGLVVDPEVLFSGLLGGSASEYAADIEVDAAGNIYVAGSVSSAPEQGFPVVEGPSLAFNHNPEAEADAFVAKLSPDGSRLIYCGYIGGERFDYATGIAVDTEGNAYVYGTTYSNPTTEHFPVLVGPSLFLNGQGDESRNQDVFLTKVSADGSRLIYSGYINGVLSEDSADVAVGADGSAYVVGTFQRSAFIRGSGRPTFDRCQESDARSNAFIAKVKPDGSGLDFQNWVLGDGIDRPLGVAVDAAGAVYVTGLTSSPSVCYLKKGPRLTYGGGDSDAFIGKLKHDLSAFEYLGFIGGDGDDLGARVAVDASGAAYVVGMTKSTEATFPVTVGPDLTFNGPSGGFDAFVAKVKPDGSGFEYCGYIGGAADDAAAGVAIDSSGRAVVTGSTASTESSFPLVGAVDATWNGGLGPGDAFVARVAANGRSLDFSTYLGGTERDTGLGVALDRQGNPVVVGVTESGDGSFPTTAGAFNPVPRGHADVFLVKLRLGPAGPPPPSISTVEKSGKFLFVSGANFVKGAKVLVNGTPYKAKQVPGSPATMLKSKKAAKVVEPGDTITVRNPDGGVSNAVTFDG